MRTFGYILSVISVVLLAIPAWKSGEPATAILLLSGSGASIFGLVARWIRDEVLNEEASLSP